MTEPDHRVFHLAAPEAWSAAQAVGELTPPTFDVEHFVHCSTAEQLVGTIERHFAGVDRLEIIELDRTTVDDDLRWEESRPGETYPHLYRPIRVADVVATFPWRREPDGSVRQPPGL